ncbi:hypothetical protein MJH12_11725 [bacterium]|nr:hypothetical protein [bacterium]
MSIEQKLQKKTGGLKTYSLSNTQKVNVEMLSLVEQIILTLELSYQNNQEDVLIDYKSSIRLLYENLVKLQKYQLSALDGPTLFKLAEASNDLAMALYKSYENDAKKKDLQRAEKFYRYSIDITPLTLSYYNLLVLLKKDGRDREIKRLYKDILESQTYKVKLEEIMEIFYKVK